MSDRPELIISDLASDIARDHAKKVFEKPKESFDVKFDLIEADDPLLRKELEEFNFLDPPTDSIQLAVDLTEHMLYYNGMGLAANQLGLPYRVFAVKANPVIVCYNPVIVDSSDDNVLLEEGCLTFPGLLFKVKRPEWIKIRYQEPNGEVVTKIYCGITARIMQHETDHLDGVMFIDRVSNLVLDMARKKAKKHGYGN